MLRELLPPVIFTAFASLDEKKIYEVRLRRNSPIVINYGGKNKVLTFSGTNEKVYSSTSIIEYVIKQATESSLYAFHSQIKQGFITAKGGIRLGIAGESVMSDNFVPTTIKNINSIDIRLPHEVVGCANIAYKFINNANGIKNTLIVSPPGAGKTTFLRDIARLLSSGEEIYNTLLVDERYEIASCVDGLPLLDIGEHTDVVSGANKMFAFTNGIRALKPDIIITDELISEEDGDAVIRAIRSGVKVIASIHANTHLELKDKKEFKELINGGYFERIIVLSGKNGPGTYEGIYDQNFKCVYF